MGSLNGVSLFFKMYMQILGKEHILLQNDLLFIGEEDISVGLCCFFFKTWCLTFGRDNKCPFCLEVIGESAYDNLGLRALDLIKADVLYAANGMSVSQQT